MLKQIILFSLTAILATSLTYAEKVPPEVAETILKKLSLARPDLSFDAVETTAIDNLYAVRINGGLQSLYVSKTGDHILLGEMFQVRPGQIVPVKDLAGDKIRQELIAAVNVDDMVVFPAASETRAVVYVFTDVDCGYCRKLHNEVVPELTLNGVEVRYLAFPRAGIGSPSYRRIASAWCADDKQAAMTALKQSQSVEENVCAKNPVASQLELGRKVGVNGTPAMVLEDGMLLPGYRPVESILKILDI